MGVISTILTYFNMGSVLYEIVTATLALIAVAQIFKTPKDKTPILPFSAPKVRDEDPCPLEEVVVEYP